MHEMSICVSIVESLEEAAKEQHYNAIDKVWLEIGPFAGVELNALRFSFDAASRGTIADNAQLEIIQRPGTAWCFGCSQTIELSNRYDPCPQCQGHQLTLVSGEELRIRQISVKE